MGPLTISPIHTSPGSVAGLSVHHFSDSSSDFISAQ
jgi:hypothetical protein